jgi:hypothetical protein
MTITNESLSSTQAGFWDGNEDGHNKVAGFSDAAARSLGAIANNYGEPAQTEPAASIDLDPQSNGNSSSSASEMSRGYLGETT